MAQAESLADLLRRARARFAISVPDDTLAAEVARLAEAPVDELSEELVLAAACLLGDRQAVELLDREYGHELRALIASLVGDAGKDVVQTVWARLLVADGDRPARLGDYGGRGSLLTWLRVVVSREAISMLRRRRDAALDDEALLGRLVTSHDPGLALIRAQSAREVKRAFEEAVAALTTRERNLLRQHLLDGLTIDELGGLYRVHRATAARWVASAREAVWTSTQRALRERLALSPSEVDSLLGAVREWIDLSLERVL